MILLIYYQKNVFYTLIKSLYIFIKKSHLKLIKSIILKPFL